jgi:hypothetical protein
MSDEELKKAQFFFDFVAKADDATEQSNERLLKKINGVLTLASTLVPIVFALGYFVLSQTKQQVTVIPIFLSLILFLLAIIRGIFLLKPDQFFHMDVLKLIEKYKDETLTFIINKSAVSWADIVNDNQTLINSRERGINQMFILITLGLIILAVAFIVAVFPFSF